MLRLLRSRGLDRADAPVFIQSFEDGNLRTLATQTRVRLVQLVSTASQVTPAALREMATYAYAVGANTRLVVGSDVNAVPTTVIADAHAAGLRVHVWTLRPEAVFLAKRYGGDPIAEVQELVRLGADGLFGDYPDQIARGLRR
jgi:glycerophosphoryl diester phosphodiesterase